MADRTSWWPWRLLVRLAGNLDYGCLLPLLGHLRLPTANRVADWRGDLRYFLRRRRREDALRNLRMLLPDGPLSRARRLARQQCRVWSRDELETYWFCRTGPGSPRVRVSGLEAVREAVSSGRGALMVTGHLGCVGVFMHWLGQRGLGVNLVFLPPEDLRHMPVSWYRYARRRIGRIETAAGRPILYTRRNRYFRMRRQLRRGEALMIAVDVPQKRRKHTVEARLLGRCGRFPIGPARLWSDSGASLFFWTIHQEPDGCHQVRIQELTGQLTARHDLQATTQVLVGCLEQQIRRHPQDWLMWESAHGFFPGSQD